MDAAAEKFAIAPRENTHGWPPGLTAVALLVTALLAAVGYGVIHQRLTSREEVRQLQAALATVASPAQVAAAREKMQEVEQETAQIMATIHILNLYNKRLTDRAAELEAQLAARQAADTETTAGLEATELSPNKPGAAIVEKGAWFVNFSSYNQRSAAENWAKKLNPLAGRADVVPANKGGKTFYRVRIVGLADRAQAENVAEQLQSDHNLPPLWVGKK